MDRQSSSSRTSSRSSPLESSTLRSSSSSTYSRSRSMCATGSLRSSDEVTECSIDLRVGGNYHIVFVTEDGTECSFRGTYLEVEPPTRTVATWLFEGWPDADAVESMDLHETDGVTKLTMTMVFRDQAGRAHMRQVRRPGEQFRPDGGLPEVTARAKGNCLRVVAARARLQSLIRRNSGPRGAGERDARITSGRCPLGSSNST